MRSRPASTTRACRLPSRLHARSTATSRRSSKPRAKPQRVVWPLVVPGYDFSAGRAGVAHLVERDLAKVEVAGSKPVSRSTSHLTVRDREAPGSNPGLIFPGLDSKQQRTRLRQRLSDFQSSVPAPLAKSLVLEG